MKKKFVFLADCLITQKAGIHYYALQFIKRTIAKYTDYDYYIVVPERFKQLNINQIVIPINSKIPFHLRIRNIWHIPQSINKLNPDIVIEMAHFGPFRLNSSIKRVTVIHDLTAILYPEWHDKASHIVQKLFLKKILKKADHIITNSHSTSESIKEYQPLTKDKISVIYPSINVKNRKHNPDNNKGVYFLSVGTIEPRKNYVQLIEAFKKVAANNSEVKLVIIGYKGWKYEPVIDAIEKSKYSDRIILKGYISEEELIDYYRNSIAFVFTTLYEGFGIPLLEAMSLESVIVSSDIAISREVCGNAALYYKDTDDLSIKMIDILDNQDSYVEMRKAALKQAIAINSTIIDLDKIL